MPAQWDRLKHVVDTIQMLRENRSNRAALAVNLNELAGMTASDGIARRLMREFPELAKVMITILNGYQEDMTIASTVMICND
jgi:hypothetical protein